MAELSHPSLWIDAHGDILLAYAKRRLHRREDAEDVVQDTLLAAITSTTSFKGDAQERTWLIGILKHKIVDCIRKSTKHEHRELLDEAEGGYCESSGHRLMPPQWQRSPEESMEQQEFWEQIERCRKALPPEQGRLFVLKYLEEVDADELCMIFGITSTNLWVRLHRVREKMKSCLEKNWFLRT